MVEQSPIAQFENLWSESNSPPDVFAFLAEAKLSDPRQQVDVLLYDQYQRWTSGIGIPVEDYFDAFPEIAEGLKLELIEEEFGYREQESGAPDLDRFLARFSFLSDTARNQLMDSISAVTDTIKTSSHRPEQESTQTNPAPEKISRFRITETIGRGAFGVVYKGFDDELKRSVAIKVPTRSRIDQAGGTEAFLREARVVANLDHPSIVPVYDVGTDQDGQCYLVSKFVDGGDLRKTIAERISFAASAKLISTIAKALHYAHRKGLVHRDVKPANILINPAKEPFLVDFGLALQDEDFGSGAGLVGTPAYMSPEQASGKGDRVDARSDIYSLGVVLYEMLTGQRPYRGNSASEMIEQIKQGEIRPPRQLDDRVPLELDRLCLKALSRKPHDRYSTALDLAEELDAFHLHSSEPASATSMSSSSHGTLEESSLRRSQTSMAHESNSSLASDEASGFASSTNATNSRSLLPFAAIGLSLVALIVAMVVLYGGDRNDSIEKGEAKHVRTPEEIPTGALTAEEVVELQLGASRQLKVPTEIKLADRLTLKLIPAGSFQMGSARDEIDLLPLDDWFFKKWQRDRMYNESPRHVVEISQSFYLAACETTVAQFKRFVASTGYKTTAETDPLGGYGWRDGLWIQSPEFNWKNVGFEQEDNHPVSNVSWVDAVEYCKWLSREEDATFRLPTEAEWEYACRAGTTTWFCNGDRDQGLKLVANIADRSLSDVTDVVEWGMSWNDGYSFTSPVGQYQPNAFGLFDMHGNAWEWCQDWYSEDFYKNSPSIDPLGPSFEQLSEAAKRKRAEAIRVEQDTVELEKLKRKKLPTQYHVFRGGGWDNYPGFCRSADRYSSHSPKIRTQWAGIRVVKEIAPSDSN